MPKTINPDNMPKGRKTEVTKKTDPEKDRPNVHSVYLRNYVRDAIFEIAEDLGVTRHAVLQYAIDYFLQDYKAGKIEIETKTTKEIVS
mgnify:CR=1 FL=1